MAAPRTKASAKRALRALMWLLAISALLVFAQTTDSESGQEWRKLALVCLLGAMICLPPTSKRLTPWIVRHDVPWRLATLVLQVTTPFRWLTAVVWRAARSLWAVLVETRAFRFLDRHRRPVGIVLVAAVSLRSLAGLSLLHQGADITLWHWAAFGSTYLVFGATAPFVAALLLSRRDEWALVTAIIWLLLGGIGVVLAALFGVFFSSAHLPLLTYPLIPEPLEVGSFVSLWLAELLLQMAAICFLGGRNIEFNQKLSNRIT